MNIANLSAFAGCIAFLVSVAMPTWAADAVSPATPLQGRSLATAETLRLVRIGGYALYLRHGPTNNAIADRVPAVDLYDCSTQRPLTEEGRQRMAKVGESIRKDHIPIGEFKVSPMCRAKQSAAAPKEGALVILRPKGEPDGFDYVASVAPAA